MGDESRGRREGSGDLTPISSTSCCSGGTVKLRRLLADSSDQWRRKFGLEYARTLKRRQGRLGDTWHLDELFVTIQGRRQHRGSKRLRLTDDQRRRLAVRGKVLGRKALGEVAGIVTPDTILRWYRKLIAKKYDGSAHRGRGRPTTSQEIAGLAVRMAKENPGVGLHADPRRSGQHCEKNHQGLDNELLTMPSKPPDPNGDIQRRERIGGLLNYYYREAA